MGGEKGAQDRAHDEALHDRDGARDLGAAEAQHGKAHEGLHGLAVGRDLGAEQAYSAALREKPRGPPPKRERDL